MSVFAPCQITSWSFWWRFRYNLFSGLDGWVFVLGMGNATLVLDELKFCICSYDNAGKKVASPKMHFLHILWEDKERPLSWTRCTTKEMNVSCAPSLQRSWFSEANTTLSGGCSGFAEYVHKHKYTSMNLLNTRTSRDIFFFTPYIYTVSQKRLLTKFWVQCLEPRLLDNGSIWTISGHFGILPPKILVSQYSS